MPWALVALGLFGCAGTSSVPVEVCNQLDDDDDGAVDEEALDARTWYLDVDGDGYGSGEAAWLACLAPSAHVALDGDCDDADSTVAPGRLESCDERDEDCDGTVDEDALDAMVVYRDRDRDGYGSAAETDRSCALSSGWVLDDRDCDDGDAGVHPTAGESCDEVDEDCDDRVDEEAVDAVDTFPDGDGDGYGTDTGMLAQCSVPGGFSAVAGDCDDADTGLSPGRVEICADGRDNDCDGTPAGCAPWGTMSLADADAVWFGDDAGEELGAAVALAGDVNGDGVADLLFGAPEDDDGGSGTGTVYLVLGPHSGAATLRAADAVLRGASNNGALGSSLAGMGDLDGDGYGELLIGAPFDARSAAQGGAAYLVSGPVTGTSSVEDVAVAVIVPEVAGPQVGTVVAGGQDLDGDGLGELLVSGRWADGEGSDRGAVAVWVTPPSGETYFTDADLLWYGGADGDGAGSALGLCGDSDGDGYGELLVGSPFADDGGAQSGAATRLAGLSHGELEAVATYVGSDINEYTGSGVDCDGTQVAVAAPGFEGGDGATIGAVFWFSGTQTGTLTIGDALGTRTGSFASEAADAVRSAGDIDGDGSPDWLVTAPGDGRGGPGAGAVWLSYGPVSGFGALLDADAGLFGADDWDRAGASTAGVGDLDEDGYDDLLVGATQGAAHEAGSVHLVRGNGW